MNSDKTYHVQVQITVIYSIEIRCQNNTEIIDKRQDEYLP